MNDNIGILKREYNEFKKIEDDMATELDTNRFFQIIEENFGYSYERISKLIQGGSYNFHEQHELNIVIRKLKTEYGIDIEDTILFLEEENITLSRIMKFIDDETEWELKEEMAHKYNINKKISNINEICLDS